MSGDLRERLSELAVAGELIDLSILADEAVDRIDRAVELLTLSREAGARGYVTSHALRDAALKVLSGELRSDALVPEQAEVAVALGFRLKEGSR